MIGEYFYVNPECSLKFGERWGKLVAIEEDELMPYGLLFDGDLIHYYFDRNEIMSEKEFKAVHGGE